MKGFDCNVKLSYEKAKSMKEQGYDFAIRYVGRIKQAANDIDKQEIDNILKAGLKIGLVQHCPPKPGIIPSKSTGEAWGREAAKFAKEAGYKQGCIVYLDLEDVNPDFSKKQQDIIDFCNAWYDEVEKDFTAGIYIGFNTWLSGDMLYSKLKFQHYWKSFSRVPDVTTRGYEMYQKPQITVNGIQIDPNEVTGDKLGNFPVFMELEKPEKVLCKIISVYNDGSIEVKEV